MRHFRRLVSLAAVMALLVPTVPAHAVPASRIDSLSFADSDTGYISGGSMSNSGFVSVTHDRGATWHATAFPNRWMSGVGAGAAGKVLAVGDYWDRVPRSADYGSSWTTGTAAVNSATFETVSYLPSGRAVLLGQKIGTRGGDVALIATSDDSSTWTERYTGPFYPAPDEYSEPPTTIAQMLAVDAAGGVTYALGNEWNSGAGSNIAFKRPLLFTSVDGGSTWTTQTASGLATAGYAATAISVVDASTAFVVGGVRGAYKTTNYGASWTSVAFQRDFVNPAMTALAIDSLDANRIAAVGEYGLLATTATGGPNWTYRSIGGGNALRGIKMLDAMNWVVTGDNETILRTSDGGASWTGPTTSQPPAVSMSAPAAGFPLTAGAVTIAGTASDTGVGVAGVEVLIRRADSMSFNGVGWVAGDTWIPAQTSNGWDTWNYSWTPDAAVLSSGQIVTVSARAKDGVGNVSNIPAASSGVGFTSAITLAGGAPYTTSLTVPVSVSAAGATHSRWNVNGGAFTAWVSGMPSSVTLPAGDGVKNVTVEFSANNGATTLGSASDSITLHTSVPSVALSAPAAGFPLTSGAVNIAGTASDTGGSIAGVQVLVRRADGMSWNGSAWVTGDSWVTAATSNSFANWSYSWTPDAGTIASGKIVTVSAKATDAAGLNNTTAGVSSGVPVTASIALAGGAEATTSTVVPVAIAANGANAMRWSGDVTGVPVGWQPYPQSTNVTLTAGDGPKSVTFEFSADGGNTVSAATSDTITLHTSIPAVAITTPAQGFSLQQGAVNITGTASDSGGSVAGVQVLVRRSDGMSWNGSAWVSGETWVSPSTSNAFATWGYAWTPDAGTIAGGQLVTISARATDAFGLTNDTPGVVSHALITAAASLAGGAQYTSAQSVPAVVSAPGAKQMRWSVNGGTPTGWTAFNEAASVPLPGVDGVRNVTFEFSLDGVGVVATAADTITVDRTLPSLTLDAPSPGFALASQQFSGTVADSASGISGVRVRISKPGAFWNGLGWQAAETWLPANVTGSNWQLSWTPDAETAAGIVPVTVTVVGEDVAGNASAASSRMSVDPVDPTEIALSSASMTVAYGARPVVNGVLLSQGAGVVGQPVYLQSSSSASGPFADTGAVAWTSAGGGFTFTVAPKVLTYYRVRFGGSAWHSASTGWVIVYQPRAYLGAPYAPTTVARTKTFTSYGSLKPRHAAGMYPVKITAQRYEKQANGTRKWVTRKTVAGRSSNYLSYSRYSASLRLPYPGRWRLRASHSDAGHAASYSAYRYVTVK